MQVNSQQFKAAARAAIKNDDLQLALGQVKGGFIDKRRLAIDAMGNFEAQRDYVKAVKQHTFKHLAHYLEQFESNVIANGGQVHWARNGAEAREIVTRLCVAADARTVTKGKSMVAEEAAINQALAQQGIEVIETDLGEYIIQLAGENPSHIIAPAIHKTRQQITDLFSRYHRQYGFTEPVIEHEAIVDQARQVLRDKFVQADVGIIGANFLIAETGGVVLVTNEGNGDLTAGLPKTHIVTASIEKILPKTEQLGPFLTLLKASATGQEMSAYTTIFNGPKRAADLDGPENFHVILLDNGRSDLLGGDYQDMLRCIRCGACMNHCPVYTIIGGHAYGWVYPGPMGAVLTPLMVGLDRSTDLPNACTFNGRCAEVCPMSIPLPDLLRRHRVAIQRSGNTTLSLRLGMQLWFLLALRPRLYRRVSAFLTTAMAWLGAKRGGRFRYLPLLTAWTNSRDLPAPQATTFQQQWRRKKNDG